MTIADRSVAAVKVQLSNDIAAGDAGWTDADWLRWLGGSEGSGSILGDANFEQIFGAIREAGSTVPMQTVEGPNYDPGETSYTSMAGRLVRLVRTDTGAAFWWGMMLSPGASPDGSGLGSAMHSAIGIGACLGNVKITRAWVIDSTGGAAVQAFDPLPFNANPAGDRSAAVWAFPSGPNAYIHDLTTTGTGGKWTAANIIGYLFAGAMRESQSGLPVGWTWTLSDPLNALAYEPARYDPTGKTVLEVLRDLCGEDRGLTWRTTVSGNVATVTVYSGSDESITAGAYTLPATTSTATYAIDQWTAGIKIQEHAESVADRITIKGARPTRTATFSIVGTGDQATWSASTASTLTGGWDSALQSAWADGRYFGRLIGPRDVTQQIMRRFVVRPTWDGRSVDKNLAAVDLIRRGKTVDANNGYTGARTYTTMTAPASLMRFAEIAYSPGFSTLRIGQRQPPVILYSVPATDGTGYVDASKVWEITIEQDPPALMIDDKANGYALAELLAAGCTILITIAIEEPDPLLLSWNRPPADNPCATPRTFEIELPDLRLDDMAANTVTGIDTAGALVGLSPAPFADHTDRALQRLALERANREQPYVTASWTSRAILDTSATLAPGVYLVSISDGVRDRPIGAVITRREWVLVREGLHARWDTRYITDAMAIDPRLSP